MSLVRGIYDKIMSIIKTDTVSDPGTYTPVSTDIVPVYDYLTAEETTPGEKMAVKKYVRITDIGTGTPDTYDLASPPTVSLGGITPSYTLTGQTWQQIIQQLLIVYQSPVINAFSINSQSASVEVGDSVSSPKTFTITYTNAPNVEPNTFEITNNYIAGYVYGPNAPVPASGSTTPSISFTPVTLTTNSSVTWTAKFKNTQNVDVPKTTTVNWYYRIFVGASLNTTLTASQIQALNVNTLLTNTAIRTYTFSANYNPTQYFYFCFPNVSGFTYPSNWVSGGLQFGMVENEAPYTNQDSAGRWYALVSVTNSFGVTAQYRVYRSQQKLSGNLSVVLS